MFIVAVYTQTLLSAQPRAGLLERGAGHLEPAASEAALLCSPEVPAAVVWVQVCFQHTRDWNPPPIQHLERARCCSAFAR